MTDLERVQGPDGDDGGDVRVALEPSPIGELGPLTGSWGSSSGSGGNVLMPIVEAAADALLSAWTAPGGIASWPCPCTCGRLVMEVDEGVGLGKQHESSSGNNIGLPINRTVHSIVSAIFKSRNDPTRVHLLFLRLFRSAFVAKVHCFSQRWCRAVQVLVTAILPRQ